MKQCVARCIECGKRIEFGDDYWKQKEYENYAHDKCIKFKSD
jgi:hypothetical protein